MCDWMIEIWILGIITLQSLRPRLRCRPVALLWLKRKPISNIVCERSKNMRMRLVYSESRVRCPRQHRNELCSTDETEQLCVLWIIFRMTLKGVGWHRTSPGIRPSCGPTESFSPSLRIVSTARWSWQNAPLLWQRQKGKKVWSSCRSRGGRRRTRAASGSAHPGSGSIGLPLLQSHGPSPAAFWNLSHNRCKSIRIIFITQ